VRYNSGLMLLCRPLPRIAAVAEASKTLLVVRTVRRRPTLALRRGTTERRALFVGRT
jgi:hypothetical protein